MGTLTEKAKQFHSNKTFTFTKQEIELCLAWAKGEVGLDAVAKVMEIKKTNKTAIYSFLARGLRNYIQHG